MEPLDHLQKIEERLVIRATEKRQPINASFELTPLCNMNCEMCFIRLSDKEMKSQGRLLTVDEWIDLAVQLKAAGTLFVLLTGGEPLLYPHFKTLYQKLRDLGMIVTINTNGTLITENIASLLEKDKPRRVNVTLYGASNETYLKLCHHPKGFDQVMQGLTLLKDHHIDVKLNGTLVPENRHEIDELIAIAKQFDFSIKIDTYIYPSSRKKICPFKQGSRMEPQEAAGCALEIKRKQKATEEFERYRSYILDRCDRPFNPDLSLSCRAGKSSIWFTWNGKMTPCVFLDIPAYDILNTDVDEAWEKMIKDIDQIHLPSCCGSCEKRDVCQICAACAYCETGGFEDRPEYMCKYTEQIVDMMKKERK